jgi:hypothetical protein
VTRSAVACRHSIFSSVLGALLFCVKGAPRSCQGALESKRTPSGGIQAAYCPRGDPVELEMCTLASPARGCRRRPTCSFAERCDVPSWRPCQVVRRHGQSRGLLLLHARPGGHGTRNGMTGQHSRHDAALLPPYRRARMRRSPLFARWHDSGACVPLGRGGVETLAAMYFGGVGPSTAEQLRTAFK